MRETARIVNKKVAEVEEKIEKGILKDDGYIDEYLQESIMVNDLDLLIEENKDRGLSDIAAKSMVVGEYMTLENLLYDVVRDILIENVKERLKANENYYI